MKACCEGQDPCSEPGPCAETAFRRFARAAPARCSDRRSRRRIRAGPGSVGHRRAGSRVLSSDRQGSGRGRAWRGCRSGRLRPERLAAVRSGRRPSAAADLAPMKFKDYYAILGVERGATADEIKNAYRRLARKYHPDVSKEANAEARFKEAAEAYATLKDPEKRAAYDQLGRHGPGEEFRPPPEWSTHFGGASEAFDGMDFADLFAGLAGHRRGGGRQGPAGAMRGQDYEVAVPITRRGVLPRHRGEPRSHDDRIRRARRAAARAEKRQGAHSQGRHRGAGPAPSGPGR